MKFLVTGGNRGLGDMLVCAFSADSISRANGWDITKQAKEIAQHSLNYDVFINNAFDGPPQEDHANFAQITLYLAVYDAWKEAGKSGYIFNIGSVGAKGIVSPEPRFETYRVAKAALEHASKQGTQAFKQDHVKFRTTLISPDRIDTPLSRSRPNWTGNGVNGDDIVHLIDSCIGLNPNSCIDEITIYCNLNHK